MTSILRAAVSGSRHRLKADGHDLDFAYVTPRLAAMGFPARGLEAAYRNDADAVASYLNGRHAGNFLVVNVSQRAYDTARFEHRVVTLGFEDKHACPLEVALTLCRTIDAYLSADPSHVVAIHCLAGKGRTGLVAASYLLYSGYYLSEDGISIGEAAIAQLMEGATLHARSSIQLARAASLPIDDEDADEEAGGGSAFKPTPLSNAGGKATEAHSSTRTSADHHLTLSPQRLADLAISHFISARGDGLGIASQQRVVSYVARIVHDVALAVAAAGGRYDRERHVISTRWPVLASEAGQRVIELTPRVRPGMSPVLAGVAEPQAFKTSTPHVSGPPHPGSCPCPDCDGSPSSDSLSESEEAAVSAANHDALASEPLCELIVEDEWDGPSETAAGSGSAATPLAPNLGSLRLSGDEPLGELVRRHPGLASETTALLRDLVLPQAPSIHLWQVVLHGVPAVAAESGSGEPGCRPVLQVLHLPHEACDAAHRLVFDTTESLPPGEQPRAYVRGSVSAIPLNLSATISGDVLIRVLHQPGDVELFRLSFHTGFLPSVASVAAPATADGPYASGDAAGAPLRRAPSIGPSGSSAAVVPCSVRFAVDQLDFKRRRVAVQRLPPGFSVELFYDVKAGIERAPALERIDTASVEAMMRAARLESEEAARRASARDLQPAGSAEPAAAAHSPLSSAVPIPVDASLAPEQLVTEHQVLEQQFFNDGFSV